jgi:hypothetical protein
MPISTAADKLRDVGEATGSLPEQGPFKDAQHNSG